jgi:hypothetical protein
VNLKDSDVDAMQFVTRQEFEALKKWCEGLVEDNRNLLKQLIDVTRHRRRENQKSDGGEMSEFSPLTLSELKRFEKLKKYRANARHAIKDLHRIAETWKQIGLKYMAQESEHRRRCTEERQLTWYIAKRRAIELGIATEEGLKHVRDIDKVRNWLDEMTKQFKLEREGK